MPLTPVTTLILTALPQIDSNRLYLLPFQWNAATIEASQFSTSGNVIQINRSMQHLRLMSLPD